MYTRRLSLPPPNPKTVVFTGGLNEDVSNLEMKPGECYDLVNYEENSGEFHGYRSTPGYEVIDGTTVTIDDPNNPGNNIDVTYPSTVPLVFTDPDDLTQVDDTAREARRDAIQAPVATGYLKGAFDFCDEYFVIARDASDSKHKLFRMAENAGAGWVAVGTFPSITDDPDSGVNYHIEIGRFKEWPETPDATPNTDIAILCNGISPAIILYKKNDGTFICVQLLESESPDWSELYTPRLPSDPSIAEAYPFRSVVYNQRLHLAFPYGTLFISHAGDPFFFDNALKSAGVWWLGSEITDLEIGPSSLIVFMEKGIDVIRPSDPDMVTGFDEIKETFSPTSGAYANTAQRVLGRTLFCDDRGITSLEATDRYGDFEATNLSRKVQLTYQANKEQIAGTAIDRERSQYLVYFKNGSGIALTVEPNYRGDFSSRGASRFSLGSAVSFVWGVRKQSKRLFGNGVDGNLRLQHKKAQSFDGDFIESKFTSSFHPYGSPTSMKTFKRLLFEIAGSKGQVFSIRPLYDYAGTDVPKANLYNTEPIPAGAKWGEGVWGEFVWGGTGAVDQAYSYIIGIGVNMSIQFISKTKHHDPHVVQNAIVMYTRGNMKF